jgi:hypothetical protein
MRQRQQARQSAKQRSSLCAISRRQHARRTRLTKRPGTTNGLALRRLYGALTFVVGYLIALRECQCCFCRLGRGQRFLGSGSCQLCPAGLLWTRWQGRSTDLFEVLFMNLY